MEDDPNMYVFKDCLIGEVNRSLHSPGETISDMYYDLLLSGQIVDEFSLPNSHSDFDRSPDSTDSSGTCSDILANYPTVTYVISTPSDDAERSEHSYEEHSVDNTKDHSYMGVLSRLSDESGLQLKLENESSFASPLITTGDSPLSDQPLLADDDSISAAKFLTVGTSKSDEFSNSNTVGGVYHDNASSFLDSASDRYCSKYFSQSSPNSSGAELLLDDELADADFIGYSEPADRFSLGASGRNGQKSYCKLTDSGSRYRSKMQDLALRHKLITNQNLKSCGQLMLSVEEKRTLLQEGYSIPTSLPLTRKEEETLKMVRRKIKNKLSAQESRRRRKEYTDELERSLKKCSTENQSLRSKVDFLEEQNRKLMKELSELHSATIVGRRKTTQISPNSAEKQHSSAPGVTGVTLTITFLLFAFLLPSFPTWSRLSPHRFPFANENILFNQSPANDPLANHVYEAAKKAPPIALDWSESPSDDDCSRYASQRLLFGDQSKWREPPSCPAPASRLLVDPIDSPTNLRSSDEKGAGLTSANVKWPSTTPIDEIVDISRMIDDFTEFGIKPIMTSDAYSPEGVASLSVETTNESTEVGLASSHNNFCDALCMSRTRSVVA